MTKYSFEFKLKVVQEYLEGKGGYSYLAKVHSVKDKKQIRVWVNSYREFGEEGLLRKRKNANYSVQFKLDAIELYQTSELSYREIANVLKMNYPSLIANWMRKFRNDGIKGLSKPKGRPPTVPKKKEKPKKDFVKVTSEERDRIKEL
ncbi:transposase, partial [Enterococcus avium]|uniref:transposase n=1 Tax=Enterococcus avium TaxID=33945 RepID=UPI003BF54F92